MTNRYQEAIKAFKEAVRINPKLALAHWGLASNYLKLGDREAALQEHKIMQTLDPDLARKFEKHLYPPGK
jgi:tetratricopeptide (TPR) repeat protein